MKLKNTDDRYGAAAKAFHWTTALLVIIAIPLGLWAAEIGPGNADPAQAALREQLLFFHKGLGVSILGITVMRITWIWISPKPAFPDKLAIWEKTLARATHVSLYVLLLAMPISGIYLSQAVGFPVTWFDLVSLPQIIFPDLAVPPIKRPEVGVGILLHKNAIWYALAAALSLHILGLLKHLLLDRDTSIWKRMTGLRPPDYE